MYLLWRQLTTHYVIRGADVGRCHQLRTPVMMWIRFVVLHWILMSAVHTEVRQVIYVKYHIAALYKKMKF